MQRLFTALKIPNIRQRELSNIFKYHAILSIYYVWQKEQVSRQNEINGKSIVVVSYMRLDSPWNSGLFGSRSTLHMDRNIILDTKVINVSYELNYIGCQVLNHEGAELHWAKLKFSELKLLPPTLLTARPSL